MRNATALAVLLAAATASGSYAGDLPRRTAPQTYEPAYAAAPSSWQGCHVGGHLGVGFGRASQANTSGAVVGAQGGCDIQSGNWVAGGEIDGSYTGMDNRGIGGGKFREKFLGSARLRAGYAVDSKILVYGTAGLAAGTGQYKDISGVSDNTHVGWVAGIGAQYKLTNNVSARAELLHYDLGKQRYGTLGQNFNVHTTNNVARVGADYHF